ncbi:MAG: DNA mismatch repair endonuclease MutH [Myxococcota bacterium]|nr:DNA mismatch repair endonuclease MutH [Myxococcota bacterium]
MNCVRLLRGCLRQELRPMSNMFKTPETEDELMEAARRLAGQRLGDLAAQCHRQVPTSFHQSKGWVGQLIETMLGTDAANRSEPDFVKLGIELKTIPIDHKGRPKETTFICTASLTQMGAWAYTDSRVCKKLSRVLWVPVQADPETEIRHRMVGNPLLWSPSADDDRVIRADWEYFANKIANGYVETISASEGEYLQMRPKGANSLSRGWGIDEDGASVKTSPKGFYLRTRFTAKLLNENYAAI